MNIRVFMDPWYDPALPDRAEGGIRRVVEAMIRYMPDHGITYTRNLDEADLAVGHGVIAKRLPTQPLISHCHGLHWAEYTWPNWAHEVNGLVISALIQAQAITVPSRWVRDAVVRSILRRPTVIHHGVEPEEWVPDEQCEEHVLWNKARADPVSNPADMQKLALEMPEVQFLTTVGTGMSNVRVLGVLPLPDLKKYVRKAGVYLATARETFGIGTLEAMSAGVPIAGWDYGGQSEIVTDSETGYLAPYGDYGALADCVRKCLQERKRLGANARQDVIERWTWPNRIQQYAELYRMVASNWTEKRPRVSIVVPCYNLAHYLPEALESVRSQTDPDWECIVVDDGSTDETAAVVSRYAEQDERISYKRQDPNQGLSATRNAGAALARGHYILFLDADDCLEPQAIGRLAGSLVESPKTHIVFGGLAIMQADGAPRPNEWPGPFEWRTQMAHINSIHTGAMMRREVWEELGGYRERCWRAEDADFWCRATSFGFQATKVTSEPTLYYRLRGDSKGQQESRNNADKDGPWTDWFPWAMARSAQEGYLLLRNGTTPPNSTLVPAGAQGTPPINSGFAWDAPHYSHPVVSVVIPVGPGHKSLILDALDSLVAQDIRGWEAIVVNDTGEIWDSVPGAPWAKVIQLLSKRGAGAARNLGVAVARAPLILFLDADDWLKPGALRALLQEYTKGDVAYVYGDFIRMEQDGRTEVAVKLQDYRQEEWRMQNGITVLIAKEHLQAVGGFDTEMVGYEDWDLFCKLAVAGYCGRHISHHSFVYRAYKGKRRNFSKQQNDSLLIELKKRYGQYYGGGVKMGSCCGGNGDAIVLARKALDRMEAANMGVRAGIVEAGLAPTIVHSPKVLRMEFTGERVGAVTYFGTNGRQYKGGNNPRDRYVDAVNEDVARLEATGVWKKVVRPEPKTPIVYHRAQSTVAEQVFPTLDRSAVETPPQSADQPPPVLSSEPTAENKETIENKEKPIAEPVPIGDEFIAEVGLSEKSQNGPVEEPAKPKKDPKKSAAANARWAKKRLEQASSVGT